MQFNLTPTGSDFARLEDIPPTQEQSGAAGARSFFRDTPVLGMAWTEMAKASANRQGPRLDADGAKALAAEYGPGIEAVEPGHYTEAAARILHQRAAEKRTDAIIDSQTPYGWGTVPRAITNSLVTLADPLNLAAMVMPIGRVGASLAARGLAAESAMGRFGWRALEGGLQGAAGMGVLEAASIPLHRDLGDETSLEGSALNIGFGGVLGALTHGLLGGLRARPEARVIPPAVERAPPEVNQAAAQTAIAQHLQGQPVAVDHLYAPFRGDPVTMEMRGIMQRELDYLETRGPPTQQTTSTRMGEADVSYAGAPPGVPVIPGETQSTRIAHPGEFWDARPIEGGPLTANEARAAYVKLSEGEPLSPREKLFTDYLQATALKRVGVDDTQAARSAMLDRQRLLNGPAAESSFAEQRAAIAANRERSILDGDGLPPRTEPTVATATADSHVNADIRAELAAQQARAIEASQRAETALATLEARGFKPRASPELAAAEKDIAQAAAEAKAYNEIVICQRLA